MEVNLKEKEVIGEEEEEEYVFLDLTNTCGQTDIPANAPYVLSGLDTENPILVIGDKLKLVSLFLNPSMFEKKQRIEGLFG